MYYETACIYVSKSECCMYVYVNKRVQLTQQGIAL